MKPRSRSGSGGLLLRHLGYSVGLVLMLMALTALTLHASSNRPPQPSFTYAPSEPTINDVVTFDASGSTDPDGELVRFEWDFDGDGVWDLASGSPLAEWLYDHGGSYQVALRVTDDDGAIAIATGMIEVEEAPVAVRGELSTPIEPNRVLPGDSFEVTVRIEVHTEVSGLGLAAELPEGWRLLARENAGAAFKRSANQWLWVQGFLPGDQITVKIEVVVPGDAQPGLYEIRGYVQSFSPRFKIPIPKGLLVVQVV